MNASYSKDYMSNFTSDQLEKFLTTLKLLDEVGMKHSIFEKRKIRAASDNKTAVVVEPFDKDLFSGPDGYVIGIMRIPVILNRLQLVAQKNPTLTLVPKDNGQYYKTMDVSSKTHSFDLRFADPEMMSDLVPKGLRGEPVYSLQITQDTIKSLQEASRAFAPENVWVHISPKGSRIEMFDPAVGEKISILLSEKEEIETSLSFKYATDVFMRLLNQKTDVAASVFSNGLMRVNYKSLDVHMLRRE